MGKTISRTFKIAKVQYIDLEGKVYKEVQNMGKVNLPKLAKDEVARIGNMDFRIKVTEVEEKREISVEDFIKHSKVVESSDPETDEE